MTGSTFLPWLHLLLGVLVTGICLFWAIMGRVLGRTEPAPEATRLLGVVAAARWPHLLVPWEMRLPLWLLGISLVVLAAGTGLLLGSPGNLVSGIKAVLVILLLVVFRFLGRAPTPALGIGSLLLALTIMAISTLLPR